MFVLVIRQREVGVPLIPFNALTGHRPALQRLPRAWHQTRAEHGAGSGRLSGGCDLPSTGNWDSGNPAFALSRGSHDGPPSTSSRCPSLARHAVVPFTFRIQVSQQTQEPPSEFLPAEPGIQPGASWRTASGQRPGPRRGLRRGRPRRSAGQAARRWLARWQRRPGRSAKSSTPTMSGAALATGSGRPRSSRSSVPRCTATPSAAASRIRPAPPARARPGAVTRPASSEYSSAEHSPAECWPHRTRHGHRGK